MAGLRISQLPVGTAVASADVFPFSSVSGSETRKITAAVLGLALTQLGLSVGPTQPSAPYNGQPWIDTSTNPPVLKVWNGATFTIVSFLPGSAIITNPAATAPASPALGQLWQDISQTPDELKMWDGANWVRTDPLGITQTTGDARYLRIVTAASTYLALAGGTLTGDLTLPGAPTATNMAATKGYVDTLIADAKSVPQNARSGAYTLVAADAGGHISITTGGVTVPFGVFGVGNVVSIYNNSATAQTITQSSGVTLRQAGFTATGNRTLGSYGIATLLCVAANTFVISGAGLT
jgi:hypothetical protein